MDAAAEKPSVGGMSLRLSAVGEYLLTGLAVFYSAVWSLYTSANSNTALRLAIPLLAVLILWRCRRIPVHLWQRVAAVGLYLAVYLAATRYNGVRFLLYYALPLLLLMLYAGWLGKRCVTLLYRLSDWVTAVAAVSLFFFCFGTVLRWIPARTASFYWGESQRTCPTYFHLYYEAQRITFFGIDLPRNCGVFPEAPGFAAFLAVATAVEMLLRPRPRRGRCALLLAATVTTWSAKALILAAAVLFLRYALWAPKGWFAHRARVVVLPLVGVGFTALAAVLLWDKLQTVSGGMRLDDVAACLQVFRTAPFFGVGYWNDDAIVPYFTYAQRYNNGLSMGAAVLLAQGGVYLSVLYGWAPLRCAWAPLRCALRGRPRQGWAAFALIYVALLLTGNMVYHFLTLLLIAVFTAVGREEAE